jgi:hypothetical protein
MTGLETYDSPIDMRETSTTFGVELTTVAAWAEMVFAGSRGRAEAAA